MTLHNSYQLSSTIRTFSSVSSTSSVHSFVFLFAGVPSNNIYRLLSSLPSPSSNQQNGYLRTPLNNILDLSESQHPTDSNSNSTCHPDPILLSNVLRFVNCDLRPGYYSSRSHESRRSLLNCHPPQSQHTLTASFSHRGGLCR